jgi:hypothetical protein
MDLAAVAVQGIDLAQVQLEAAALGIARATALSPDAASTDTVDISAEVVALLSAKNQFSVHLTTLRIADETQKSVVDLPA